MKYENCVECKRENTRVGQNKVSRMTGLCRTCTKRGSLHTPNGKKSALKAIKKYEAKNPARRKAWNLAQRIPLENCVVCGKVKVHRHHPDPLKPLSVIFLCALHHKWIHTGKLQLDRSVIPIEYIDNRTLDFFSGRAMQSNNTSGYTGVSWYKITNRWSAEIYFNKKHIKLGYFSSKEDAHKAYLKAKQKYYTQNNNPVK